MLVKVSQQGDCQGMGEVKSAWGKRGPYYLVWPAVACRVISANPVSGPCSWFLVRRLLSPGMAGNTCADTDWDAQYFGLVLASCDDLTNKSGLFAPQLGVQAHS